MVEVRFMTLVGKFALSHVAYFASFASADAAVSAHAAAAGYTDVRRVAEEDGVRWTARTPGGRHGRNVAFTDC